MEAEHTVLHLADIELMTPDEIASMQAAISFEAGIKEVVKEFETVLDAPAHYRLGMFFDILNTWQAKLKEWGIKEEK